jgi:hypothetical protein
MSTLSRRIDASKGKVHRSTVTPNPEIAGILVPHGLLGKQNPDGAHTFSCRQPEIPDLTPNLIREKMKVWDKVPEWTASRRAALAAAVTNSSGFRLICLEPPSPQTDTPSPASSR